MNKETKLQGVGKPTPRASRYGKLVRGWGWRTTPERLQQAEAQRLAEGIGQTELLEKALDEYMERHKQ